MAESALSRRSGRADLRPDRNLVQLHNQDGKEAKARLLPLFEKKGEKNKNNKP